MKAFNFLSISAVSLLASAAHGGIAGTSGDVSVLGAPPVSVREGDQVSNSHAVLFAEQTDLTLTVPVMLDFHQTGFYNDWNQINMKMLLPGTRVNSYLLHADQTNPFGSSFSGAFAFEPGEQILGVLVRTGSLNNTDTVLGAPILYPQFGADREVDLNQITGGDSFLLTSTGPIHSIAFNFSVWAGVDQMRIVTAPVPEPASLALLAAGALACFRRR